MQHHTEVHSKEQRRITLTKLLIYTSEFFPRGENEHPCIFIPGAENFFLNNILTVEVSFSMVQNNAFARENL